MSLLTRCPACTTVYKVVPDQLRISQGWVKCGQCGEIFDASQHLMEASTEAENPVLDSAHAPASLDKSSAAAQQLFASQGVLPEAPAPWVDAIAETEFSFEPDAPSPVEPEASSEPAPVVSLSADLGPLVQAVADQDLMAHEDALLPPPPWEPLDIPGADPESPAPQPEDASPLADLAPPQEPSSPVQRAADVPVSFMRDAPPASIWQHPKVNIGLAVLLALMLGGQWVYQDHDRLAAARPQWKPALVNICRLLHCSVMPWQQIESIAIDAAAFNKLGDDLYRLSFTLKNAASVMLAWPSIELTLTDAQDRVVVRRVLSPPELAAVSDQLAARSEWPVLVNLRVTAEASSAAVVGYRLLAFYP